MSQSTPAISGKRVCKLMLVEINDQQAVDKGKAKQSNKFYNMYEQDNDTFIVQYGRVDSTCAQKIYPIQKWDKTIKSKLNPKKGYKDVTHLFQQLDQDDSNDQLSTVDISDIVIQRLMDQLQSYANTSIQQNYTVSSNNVTQAMVDGAQDIINQLMPFIKRNGDIAQINKLLLELYHTIPRKMKDVNSHLITDLSDKLMIEEAGKLIEDEQQTLDVMAGQVNINNQDTEVNQKTKQPSKTILDILGLTMEDCCDDDIKMIKKLMGQNSHQFKSAFKVTNISTQNKYDVNLTSSDNDKQELFWHGSRNQNWLNIISTGLMIRPAGAIHTGSMFGDGVYFADKAQKSIGYTSLRGSYWTSGHDDKAYLALFSVHVGKQKDIHRHNSSCYSLNRGSLIKDGYDSVFAHGGADLRNNEYIVYEANQCTISYLIEIA